MYQGLETLGYKFIVALLILVIGVFLSRYLKRWIYKILADYDETISRFMASVANIVFITLVVVSALAELGLSIAPVTGVITGIVFGISMSLKSSYSTVASGIMLAFSKPFSVGDMVDIGGAKGRVTSIGFLYTKLEDENMNEIIMSNNLVMTKVITRTPEKS